LSFHGHYCADVLVTENLSVVEDSQKGISNAKLYQKGRGCTHYTACNRSGG